MNELHLFAGAGGGIFAGRLLGHRCIGAVERDPYAQQVLLARQRDGSLPEFPIFSDIRHFDGRPYAGRADIVAGGFPCQDISAAGKGAGIDGERSGLWSEMARVVSEVRPRFVYVENSPMLTSRGLGRVLGDLAALGFDAEWGVLGAADVGAPHQRDRIWLVAYTNSNGLQERVDVSGVGCKAPSVQPKRSPADGVLAAEADANADRWERPFGGKARRVGRLNEPIPRHRDWQITSEPVLGGGTDGMAYRINRLKALGNGQVPRVAATAWRILTEAAC